MNLPAESIESLCDYADGLRAEHVSWEGVLERLREADRRGDLAALTVAQLQGWHAASQKRKFREQTARERVEENGESGMLKAEMAMAEGEWGTSNIERGTSDIEEGGAARSFSDEVRELVKYLGVGLVGKVGRWQFARHRVLRAGESFERHRGPGELAGVAWKLGAVSIWRERAGQEKGEHRTLNREHRTSNEVREVVEVLPEHRVKRLIPVKPPWMYHETLRLEVFSFENLAAVKVCQQLLEMECRLRGPGIFPARRKRMERTLRRLEAKAAFAGDRHGVTVLKVQEIVSRLATTVHLYMPQATGAKSGAELGRALSRTRAAVSAAKLKKVEEDTAKTGGRAGFEGMRAADRHREKGRGKVEN